MNTSSCTNRTSSSFYQYDEPTGLWLTISEDKLKNILAQDLKAYSDSQDNDQIIQKSNDSFLNHIISRLRGPTEQREPFKRLRSLIHLGNGMLHMDIMPPELKEFSPQYFSRNQCPISIDEKADCPKFKHELLESALRPADISLLQRYCGSLLLGGNRAQKIMITSGAGKTGKSTTTEIVEGIVGTNNVVELRTDQLHERFEIGRFINKTLLTGKDVPANFLMLKGASYLKKLVGHDLLSAELKNSNGVFDVRGQFDVMITSNSRLIVKLEGDEDAWRRRLLIIDFQRIIPRTPIREFAKVLLAKEGAGILNWMIQGAIDHLAELRDTGDFRLTKEQAERVDQLLAEGDSLREFLRRCVKKQTRSDVTVSELSDAYRLFCENRGWEPFSDRIFNGRLPDLMRELYGLEKRHDIHRPGGDQRGFKGAAIVEEDL